MEKIKTKRKITILNVLAIALAFYIVFTFITQEIVLTELNEKNQKSQIELEELKAEVSDIERKIDKSDTAEYIEKIAREELDMVKPREIIYRDKNKQDS